MLTVCTLSMPLSAQWPVSWTQALAVVFAKVSPFCLLPDYCLELISWEETLSVLHTQICELSRQGHIRLASPSSKLVQVVELGPVDSGRKWLSRIGDV